MSCPIDPREVYEYLQELGYTNISTRQLREFIKDLKKLIKYEERKKQQQYDKENICQEYKSVRSDTFETLYVKGTEATKAKVVTPKADKVITVQIKQHKDTCRHKRKVEPPSKEDVTTESKASQASLGSKISSKTEATNESDKVVVRVPSTADSKRSTQEIQGFELKPKASFIRPKSSVKTTKSDPVTLYHRYQAEWKKQKIPGEENHSNLRWVIREKMLGEPQTTISTDIAKRKVPKSSSRS